jgi:5-methylcytosine-specific restriction endonuclease McrA
MSNSNRRTLLLNSSYEVISFISERKMFKLFFKGKVEIIEEWDQVLFWGSGQMKHPAIIRLKYHVKRNYFNSNFSRKALVKRDNSTCQFCNKKLPASQVTVDHVIPRAQGGITSFINCVVACHACNNKKADRTPEQAGMVLVKKPTHPSFTSHHYVADHQEHWFSGWEDFLNN